MQSNSARQGLTPYPTTLFEDNPRERSRFDSLKAKLFEQILPDGELELQTFQRYVFAIHQAIRMHQFEIDAQARWTNEPAHPLWFQQMERIQKLAILQERRADKALSEIRKLQSDRLNALEVQNELHALNQFIPIPATLPVSAMRRSNLSKTSPALIAMMLLSTAPEIKSILSGQTKPNPVEPVDFNPEDLLHFHENTKR
jgi:hypothetical protein